MVIYKSNIHSVINYDMPKQEIERAGRDGKLASCLIFLNNEDFFVILWLILSDFYKTHQKSYSEVKEIAIKYN